MYLYDMLCEHIRGDLYRPFNPTLSSLAACDRCSCLCMPSAAVVGVRLRSLCRFGLWLAPFKSVVLRAQREWQTETDDIP